MDVMLVCLFLLAAMSGVLKGQMANSQEDDDSGERTQDDAEDACDPAHHTVLDDPRRSSGFSSIHLEPTQLLSDHSLQAGWYRLTNKPGTKMPMGCVAMGMCGTRYPVWMAGSLPAEKSSAVVTGCINTEDEGCCNERIKMVVRNCGAFYIYHLPELPRCVRPAAYCTERGPWVMVFKAVRGISFPDPYDLWTSEESLNENIPEASAIGTGYQGHFKSALVREWNSLNIAEVRVSLYETGIEVLRVVFDGSGTDKTSWFNAERIVSSPYQDLNASETDLLEIMVTHHNHRFMMSRSAVDCRNANGWMLMVASAGVCDWETEGPFPRFRYSRTSSSAIWDNRQVGDADELAIFMRTEEAPVCREKSYQVIRNIERGVNAPKVTGELVDDNTLTPGWYRFNSPAGEEVTRYCQKFGSCGTKYPIWLMDLPSTESRETVKGTMCINTDEPGCCNEKIQVLVRNCGGFYIYRLPQLETAQPAAYCTGFVEWDLVMKGVSIPDLDAGNLYELWESHESLNADVPEAQLMDTSFPEHFKSSLVADWGRMAVQQVRLSLYKSGQEVRRFIFNGEGSDRLDWFSQDRIIETPYTDMTASSTYTYFTIGSRNSRQFFINNVEGGWRDFCSDSVGWLAVSPGRNDCLSGRDASPSFLYSARDTSVRWVDGPVETADVLAIFVKSPLLTNPCNDKAHVTLSDTRRSADIILYSGWEVDDRTLSPSWYLFTDAKGAYLNMPTSCVDVHRCGTHHPIWIDDQLPERPGERKPLKGCINTGKDGCCDEVIYLGAINCGEYIVYGLDRVPTIEGDDESAAYCTESEEWQLVFKLRDGFLSTEKSFHQQLWQQDSSVNTDIPQARQLDNAFLGNYKNSRVRLWDEQIDKVKVTIYKDGVEKIILVFDGEDTDRLSWFSKEKLIFSPWTDLNGPGQFSVFSIEGQYTPPVFGTRRWFINKNQSSCIAGSEGWLVVIVDAGFLCAPDIPPQILYSNTSTAENWTTGSVEKGDLMAVFVSTKRNSTLDHWCNPWP